MQRKHIVRGLIIAVLLLLNVIAAQGELTTVTTASTTVTVTTNAASSTTPTPSGSSSTDDNSAKKTESSISPTTMPTKTTSTLSPAQTSTGTTSTTSEPTTTPVNTTDQTTEIPNTYSATSTVSTTAPSTSPASTSTTSSVTTSLPTTSSITDLSTTSISNTSTPETLPTTISTMTSSINLTSTPSQTVQTSPGTTPHPSSTSTVTSDLTQPSTTVTQVGSTITDSNSSAETVTPTSTLTTVTGKGTTGAATSTISTTPNATTTAASTPTSTKTTTGNGTTVTTASTVSTTPDATTTAVASTPTTTQTTTGNGTTVTTTTSVSTTPEATTVAVTSTPTSIQTTTDKDDCENQPCENGGTCQDHINNFTCECVTGWTGFNCSINIDDCEKEPCENGGTCHDHINNFTCECVPGWTGFNCNTDIDDCEKQPCENGGTCHDHINNFTCDCVPGWTGFNCSINIDDCDNQTCENGGTCHDHINNFTCECLPGWTGFNCSTDVDECKNSLHNCDRNADCTNNNGGFDCQCRTGFDGNGIKGNCTDIDECATTPCHNSSTCFNMPGSFKCFCANGWTGLNCSTDINECEVKNDSCATNSDCNNSLGNFSCTCKDGYRGDGFNTCTQNVLIEVDSDDSGEGDDNVFGPYDIDGGIPYFGRIYNTFYVSINGYITLGRSLNKKYPPSSPENWSRFDHPIIAPLWADIEMEGPASGVSITYEQKKETLHQISDALNITDLSKGIVVTWKKAVPYPYSQNANHEEADFQLIIYTSGSNTVLVFNYDQEIFTWTNAGDRNVAVGYSRGDNTGNQLFNSKNFAMANKNSSGSAIKGRWIFNVTSSSPSWTERSNCVSALEKLTTVTNDSIRQDSEPCPCSLLQASMDLRFRFDRQESGYSIYRSRFRRKPYNSSQICHYSDTDSLIKGYPNGGYLDIDTTTDVQKAYNMCCPKLSTCYLFYQVNPSDSCSRYLPPTWSLSWGDPHITTLDGTSYTFSGRGEYTLLQHNKTGLQVQVRTERPTPNNTDATVFVGLAAQEGNGPTVEILLDRHTNTSDIYINGNKTMTFPNASEELNDTLEVLDITLNSTANPPTIKIAFESGIAIQVGVRNILDIIVSAPKNGEFKGTTYGLLGNNNGLSKDDFVTKNGTDLNDSAYDEEQLYPFGESWKISESESLFGYYKTGNNYSYFNDLNLMKPKMFISNYSAYIMENCTEVKDFSNCNGNKVCMFDTAATCSADFGTQSKETEKEALTAKEDIENMPPTLNIQDPLYVGFNANKTVQIMFQKSNISISCRTNISNLICNNDTIHWNVSTNLRHSPVDLVIIATGERGAPSEYRPRIYYCGCQKESECDYSLIQEDAPVYGSENFFRARCNCSDDTLGDFCEEGMNLCNNNPCYENVSCDRNITSGNPCGNCPEGLIGDGLKCYDENECATGKDDCEQICTNTEGSFECSCTEGFELISRNLCTDIDECSRNRTLCGDKKYCENTVGSFNCLCRPGFATISGNCVNVQDKWSYAGVLVYKTYRTDTDTLNRPVIDFLERVFNNTGNLTSVEIVSTMEEKSARKKRDVDISDLPVYKTSYVLHLEVQTTPASLEVTLQEHFNKSDFSSGYVFPDVTFHAPFAVSPTDSRIFSDQDGGVCEFPALTTCDPISTNCSSENGTHRCICKEGFEGWEYPDISCKDVNECEQSPKKCQGGICENNPGGFTCKCPAGFMYDGVEMCKDLCKPSPCLNDGECVYGDTEGQYICKCDDKWAGQNCENKNKQAEKLKIVAIAVGASVGAVCLLLLLALFGMYRRNKHKYSGYRRPLSTDFDSAFGITMPSVGTKDFPIDDDTDTAFSIPRPNVNRSNGYDHLAEREMPDYRRLETGDSGRLEQPKEPLTKRTTESKEDDGIDNSSFLHSSSMEEARRSSKRTSRNPYEYF